MELNLLNPTMCVLSNYADNLTIKVILLSVGFRQARTLSVSIFKFCSVSRLHLKWQEPFDVRIVPKTEGCSLLSPKELQNYIETFAIGAILKKSLKNRI